MSDSNNFENQSYYSNYTDILTSMGFKKPLDVQVAAWSEVRKGDNSILLAPTGSGKTLCYLMPFLEKWKIQSNLRIFVFVPTREVGEQIQKVASRLCPEMKSTLICGGSPQKPQISQLNKKPSLVIATPGRMAELLKNNKLLLQGTSLMVFEEFDRLLESNFKGPIQEVLKTMRGEWQTLFVSATLPEGAQNLIEGWLCPQKKDVQVLDLRHLSKPDISVQFYRIDGTKKREKLLEILQSVKGRSLVFSYDQYVCEDVFNHLKSNGQSVDRIHGKQNPAERSAVVQNFRNGKYKVLVTTDLLARGLDFEDVDYVINFDLSENIDSFRHRMGRTGRAGRKGHSISLVSHLDQDKYISICKELGYTPFQG